LDIYASDPAARPDAQFARGVANAAPHDLAELERAIARFDRKLLIEPDGRAREQTLHGVAAVRESTRDQFAARAALRSISLTTFQWCKARRADHLVTRLAVAEELFSTWCFDTVTVNRGAAVDGPLPDRAPASFVSATLSFHEAEAVLTADPENRAF
jgi:hypothetical protein